MVQSDSKKEIYAALAKFEGEVLNPKNTEKNDFFKNKYAPLDVILNTIRPVLSKNGLAVFQNVSGDGDSVSVTTIITHSSGEYIESDTLTLKNGQNKGVNEAQAAGVSITYARRYQLAAMLGIASEDDTDGNMPAGNKTDNKQKTNNKEISKPVSEPVKEPESTPPQQQEGLKMMVKGQLKKINELSGEIGLTTDDMKGLLKQSVSKETFKTLTFDEADRYIKVLERMASNIEQVEDEEDIPAILRENAVDDGAEE
jgi:hypothetical protein